jgi:PAS domain S-box-containing protein
VLQRVWSAPAVARYAVAVSAAAVGLALRLAFDPVWSDRLPLIMAFPAIMVSAWFGGFWPGIVTTALSAVGVSYLWMSPVGRLSTDGGDLLGLLALLGIGALISGLNEGWRRAVVLLERSDERLRATLAGIGDGVIATDEHGRITRVNAVAASLTGWPEAEALGRPLREVFVIVDEHTRQPADNPAEQVLRDGSLAGLADHTVLLARDGREINVDDSAAPILATDGGLAGAVMVFRDVSLRRRVERERATLLDNERAARATAEKAWEQLKEAQRALQETDRRKDEFLAMLAHELRNPLGAIGNAAQVIKQLGPAEGNLRWARDVIDRQIAHLSRILDDLLDVSRISRGQIALRSEPMPVRSAVALALETALPLLEAGRLRFESEMAPDPMWVNGDATRLAQVISNLLSNAARYTPAGGTVTLTVRREGNEVLVSVRDTGIGIAPDILPHVFGLFVQADRSLDRTAGGLGLGLTLARRLTEMHGGRIEAFSAGLGQGSEFVVRLPMCAPLAADVASPPAPAGGAVRRRVLIVEDNADAAESLAITLTGMGHEIRLARDGPSALEAAAEFKPDVALLDIGLPGMDGYEVGRRLRAASGSAGILLVALTGYGQEEDRRRTRDAGFDHHFVKPIRPDAILEILGRGAAPVASSSPGRPASEA